MNQTITNAIESVKNAYPSIYTKDDVIALLTGIDENLNDYNISEEMKAVLLNNIERKLDRMSSSEVIDYDSVEFNIGYGNILEIDSADVNVSNIIDVITEAMDDVLDYTIEND